LYAGYVFVTPGIVAIDTATGNYTTGFTTNSVPFALGVTPDGSTLWAKTFDLLGGSGEEFLTPISLATSDVGAAIPIGPGPTDNSTRFRPQDLVITPNGKKAYVGVEGNGTIVPVDLVNRTAGPPIVIDRGGRPVDALAMTPDGRTVEVADKTVTPINVATNAKGNAVRTGNQPIALSITADQAPDAEIVATARPHGAPTSFDASGSHAVTGLIKTYAWQFGDGQTATTTSATTTHVYSQPGSYTATLTVTDTAGTSTTVVFTGQSVLRNGGPSAQKSVTLNIG
jgi:hypothetical protein